MTFFRVTIMTKMERNHTISVAREAISGCSGWVVNHTLFSNTAANINFELPLEMTGRFIDFLEAAGFSPNIEGDLPQGDKGDIRGNLSLTFLHNDPDFKRDVPAFG